MALPFYVNSGATANGTNDVTPGAPASPAVDDIWILFIEGAGEDVNADGPPSGGDWTSIGSIASGTGGFPQETRCSVYWHRYAGVDPNRQVLGAGNHATTKIHAIRGCKSTGSPVHQVGSGFSGSQLTSHSAATGFSTTVADCLIVLGCALGDTPAISAQANTALTDVASLSHFTTFGNDGTGMIIYGGLASAGSAGTFTWTTDSGQQTAWLAFGLEPEGAGGSVALTGTALDSITEEDVRAGGKTLVLTLTGDTWIA